MHWFELTVTHNNVTLFATTKESGTNEQKAKLLYAELASRFKKEDGYRVHVFRMSGYGEPLTLQYEEEQKWIVDFDVHDNHGLVEGASFKKGFNSSLSCEAYVQEQNRMGAGLVVKKVRCTA